MTAGHVVRSFGLLRIAALALVLLPVFAGCASLDRADGGPTAATVPRLPAEAPRVVGPSLSAAEREHERLVALYGGAYRDAKLEAWLDEMVARLVAQSDRPDVRYKLTILNVPSVNAFALPTGRLYVTRGLLALANDSSEVAAVIAHEMAHVSAKHATARADREKQKTLVSRVLTQVIGDQGAGDLSMARSKIDLASFSQQQELEADMIGVRTIARAGYDPYGAARFLVSMGRQSDLRAGGGASAQPGGSANDFTTTHPSTPARIERAIAAARQFGEPGAVGRDRVGYLTAIDGIAYGDDPEQGFMRDRTFVHPKLGFTFVAPAGFTLDNTPRAILGVDAGGRALRLDTVKPTAGQSLVDYLASGWIDGVETGSSETLRINGLDAATAVARGGEWSFRLYAIRLGADVYRLIFAARDLDAATDAMFKATAATFRPLTAAEKAGVRPLRIDVVTVKVGDTPASLASRMAFADRRLERFLILNGLDAGAALTPGDRMKIVVP